MNNLLTRTRRTWITAFLFILFATLYIIMPKVWPADLEPEIVKHLLIVLSVIMGVHIIDQLWLWRDMADSLEKVIRDSNQLISGAASFGITNIYLTRKQAQSEIMQKIRAAEHRALFLGVAFSENIRLDEIVNAIGNKVNKEGFDFRMLLLDALRSTGTFRAFLESSPEQVKNIVSINRDYPPVADPIFDTRLFRDFTNSISILENYPDIAHAIRFYAHTPICWLVIIDNKMYFQPYTFGRGKNSSRTNPCIGDLMPLFEIEAQETPGSFDILKDHFDKIWLTSDSDLFHTGARRADKIRIVKEIFQKRSSWLTQVYLTLYKNKVDIDRRRFPRQLYESNLSSIWITWKNHKTESKIRDSSKEGLCLEFNTDRNFKALEKNQEITLEIGPIVSLEILSRFKIDQLLKEGNKYFVARKKLENNSKTIIGIKISYL